MEWLGNALVLMLLPVGVVIFVSVRLYTEVGLDDYSDVAKDHRDTRKRQSPLQQQQHHHPQLQKQGRQQSRRLEEVVNPVIESFGLQGGPGGETLTTITDGMEINLNLFWHVSLFNIKAEVDGTKSVAFIMLDGAGTTYTRTDSRNAYQPLVSYSALPFGSYVLTATPFSENKGTGVEGTTVTIHFTLVNGVARYLPQFVGEPIALQDYPLDIGESQGGLIGTELFSVGGFQTFTKGPIQTYALDLSKEDASWRPMADCPIDFWTHAAFAVKKDRFYMCGGYLSAHPGKSMKECFVFDKSAGPIDPAYNLPMGSWIRMKDLPQTRGGSGMVYVESHNALLYSLGAERDEISVESTDDKLNTWMLDLGDEDAEWENKTAGPYFGNHITALAAYDCEANRRYYFLGGQVLEDEFHGNIKLLYEYLPHTDEWVQRKSMEIGRGHFSNSAVPYGCGFLIVGGAIDGSSTLTLSKTSDVSYYDIPTDTWFSIGDWPNKLKTPLCVVYDDALWCTNGYKKTTKKWQLSYPIPYGNALSRAPSTSPAPTATPSMTPSVPVKPIVIMDYSFTTGADGMTFKDGIFRGVTASGYVSNWWSQYRKSLCVNLGGNGDELVENISGGYRNFFTLEENSYVTVQFSYMLLFEPGFEEGDDVEVLCSIDGTLFGQGMNDYVDIFYGGDLPGNVGWRTASLDLGLRTGGVQYEFAVGGYLTRKDDATQSVRVFFDNVLMVASPQGPSSSPTSSPLPFNHVLFDFDFADDRGMFTYIDDAFRDTANPPYARGWHSVTYERLVVGLGGEDDVLIEGMSGAWKLSFVLGTDARVAGQITYSVAIPALMSAVEYVEVLCSIDDSLYGTSANDYLDKIFGTTERYDTPWRTVDVNFGLLPAGTAHEFAIGGYLSTKDNTGDFVRIVIDSVVLTADISEPTDLPTHTPTASPTYTPTDLPTSAPTYTPTESPAFLPTRRPTTNPTTSPISPTAVPTPLAFEPVIFDTNFTDNDGGFVYADNVFRDAASPSYALGWYSGRYARLVVALGGDDELLISNMSGAWKQSFALAADAHVSMKLRYSVTIPAQVGDGDDVEVLCSMDGTLYGIGANDYIDKFIGSDSTTTWFDSGWKTADVDLGLQAGGVVHEFAIGGYLSKKEGSVRYVRIVIDELLVIASTPEPTIAPTPSPIIIDARLQSSTDGFQFVDDPFRNTAYPSYARGWWNSRYGRLIVILGGKDDAFAERMSGGWKSSYSLAVDSTVILEFSYRVYFDSDLGSNEDAEILCSVDGTLYGRDSNVDYVDKFIGSDAASSTNTGWRRASVNFGMQSAGVVRKLAIGGYLSRKDATKDSVKILLDDILLHSTLPALPRSTIFPSPIPTYLPSTPTPTSLPSTPTSKPSREPTPAPTGNPTPTPTSPPTTPTSNPSRQPTPSPTSPPSSPLTTVSKYDFVSGGDGFQYMDNAFGGTNSAYADGWWNEAYGRLVVFLGGEDDSLVENMSGGWAASYSLEVESIVVVEIRYMVFFDGELGQGEDVEILCRVDGKLYGTSSDVDYVHKFWGFDGVWIWSSGWKTGFLYIGTQSGTNHDIVVGGSLSKKNDSTEIVRILIDYVTITAAHAM